MSKIFISYRRSDSQEVVGRLYDALVAEFSRASIFRDLDSIPLSVPFPAFLQDALERTDVVLVVIGAKWLSTDNRRRLDDPSDAVRVEIETALRLGRPTIPIVVSNARLPAPVKLPESLRQLLLRNGMPVRPDPDFHRDVAGLIQALRKLGIEAEDEDVRQTADSLRRAESEVEQKVLGFLVTFDHLLSSVDIPQIIKMVPRSLVPLKNLCAEQYAAKFFGQTGLSRELQLPLRITKKVLLLDTVRFLLQSAWDKGYFMAKFYRQNRIPGPQTTVEGAAIMDHIVERNGQLDNLCILVDVFLQRAISRLTEVTALTSTFDVFPFAQELKQAMLPHTETWGDTVRTVFGFAVLVSETEDELVNHRAATKVAT